MKLLALVIVLGMVGTAAAEDLPKEVQGAWAVPGFYGRSFAVYSIAANGKVVTEVPRVAGTENADMSKQDMKTHWMQGGTVTQTGDGKYLFRNPDFFKQFKGTWPQGEDAWTNGIAFTIDKSSTPPKIVWKAADMMKTFFPDNVAISPEELAKAKAQIEPFRNDTEKSPWTVMSSGDCKDASIAPGKAPFTGSSKLYKLISKEGSTVRFNRDSKELTAVFSANAGLTATYIPSALEKSVQIRSGNDVLTLLDQGEESGQPGVHRLRANVDGKCREITASNQPATSGKPASGSGAGGDIKTVSPGG